VASYNCEPQDHKIQTSSTQPYRAGADRARNRGAPVRIVSPIKNTDRAVGGMLSAKSPNVWARRLTDDTINVRFTGTAGQSFGAWLARGVTFGARRGRQRLRRQGDSPAAASSRGPPPDAGIVAGEIHLVGNTVLYGAIEANATFAASPASDLP